AASEARRRATGAAESGERPRSAGSAPLAAANDGGIPLQRRPAGARMRIASGERLRGTLPAWLRRSRRDAVMMKRPDPFPDSNLPAPLVETLPAVVDVSEVVALRPA